MSSRLRLRFALLLILAAPAAAQILVDATATRFPSPAPLEYTNQVAAGDLDGDGDLDLVFANGGNYATAGTPQPQRIYLNDGNGFFTDVSAARLNFSGLCRGVSLGDIDNDGDLDLLFAQDFSRRPALFRNNGSGFFTDVSAARLPATLLSSSRGLFADIDNDGDLDIYFANGGASRFGCGQLRVYVNDGAGFYSDQTAARHPIENVCQTVDVAVADVDGDFDLDVKTAGRGAGNCRYFKNDGSGAFAQQPPLQFEAGPWSYDFGDFEGDGDLDLVALDTGEPGSGDLHYTNAGAGTYGAGFGLGTSVEDRDSKFFDYDGDGDLDIILAHIGAGGESIYENVGGYTAPGTALIDPVNDSTTTLQLGDFDGDGRFDLVTGQGESGSFVNRIYLGTGVALDVRPPRIVATEALGDTGDHQGPYVVRAAILDDMTADANFFAEAIELTYSVDGGPPQTVPMRHSGGQIYRGEIPGLPGGTVGYTVSARDFAGNTGTGQSQSFEIALAGLIFADGFETGDTSAW